MVERRVSKHFTLYQLTSTSHTDIQPDNRLVPLEDQAKLTQLAALLEDVWDIIGTFELTSAYRCPILNRRVGGSPNSQHMKGEAGDIVPIGMSINEAFDKLVKAAKAGYFKFGQMIVESTGGTREGRKEWIHVSLGAPHRPIHKSGQVLKMVGSKYELVVKIPQGGENAKVT